MTQLQHKRSLWVGTLVTPWIVPLGIFVVILTDTFKEMPSINVAIELFFMIVLFGVSFTYIVTLALVAPMAFWLKGKNALSAIRLCIWCTALGPITMFIYSLLLNGLSTTFNRTHLTEILFTMAFGLASGVVFCLVSGARLCVRQKR
ncbi:MAG: hypothetical protein KBE15_01375 [Budvicia sp.]|nr:hypothetical protein [Budvicia sp.]